MNTTDISSIATAVSAVVGCVSIWMVFYTYKINNRDKKTKELITALVESRAICSQLNGLLNYEFAYEITMCILDTERMTSFLKGVHSNYIVVRDNKTEEDLKKYIDDHVKAIMCPVHSPYVDQFNSGYTRLINNVAVIDFDHPGVGRIIACSYNIFNNTFLNLKRMVHDEKAWNLAICQIFTTPKEGDECFEEFKERLADIFVGTWQSGMTDKLQANIDDVLSAVNLVTESFLRKTSKEMEEASKEQKKVPMRRMDETKTVADDMVEAENSLSNCLDRRTMINLGKCSAKLVARDTPKSDDSDGNE